MLMLLTRKARPGTLKPKTTEDVLKIVKDWRWHEFTGEVMFAYSLLMNKNASTQADIQAIVNACKTGVQRASSDGPGRFEEVSEMGWKLLTLNFLDDGVAKEVFAWLNNRTGAFDEALDTMQIETLSALL